MSKVLTRMKLKLLILLLFVSGALSAQVTLNPCPIVLELSSSVEGEIVVDLNINNENTDPALVWWNLILNEEPTGWTFYMCDSEQCYGMGTTKNAPSKPNTVENKTDHVWTLHFSKDSNASEYYEGTYIPVVKLFSDSEYSDLLYETSACVSSTKEDFASNIKIYPNPTEKYFNLTNDENVSSIGVYNIVGKEIIRESHSASQSHDVADLQRGMYIVRLYDNTGNVIRSQRLSKR